jgi:glycosyltransferase involved in cell wall biosynthesis
MKNNICLAIPAHNEELGIRKNLVQIYSNLQNPHTTEIYICLSACTDNTEKEVRQFMKEHKKANVHIIRTNEKGKVLAYKKLDEAINNDIRIFLDSDCCPTKGSIERLYTKMQKESQKIQIVSGNAIDPRYTNKGRTPRSLIEAFNMSFWQHPPRKIINGQFFAARKGVVQHIPNDIKLDDVFLTIILWNKFKKDNKAIIIQGSPQSMFETVRYQRNIVAGKLQIKKYLSHLSHYSQITKELYAQFDIKLSDRPTYYPNIKKSTLAQIQFLLYLGQLWGRITKPTWNSTVSSKELAYEFVDNQ